MASQVDIANLALTMLGNASRITSLTENSKAANAINAVYDMCRLAELRAYRWAFAIKRATLPALASPPAWGFGNAFQLPTDYLSLIQAAEILAIPALSDYSNSDNAQWAIESGQILTDLGAPLPIRYVRNVTDEGEFDPLFNMAFAGRLAATTCETITGSNTKRQLAQAEYKDAIKSALRINAIERAPSSIADDSWLVGRL